MITYNPSFYLLLIVIECNWEETKGWEWYGPLANF